MNMPILSPFPDSEPECTRRECESHRRHNAQLKACIVALLFVMATQTYTIIVLCRG